MQSRAHSPDARSARRAPPGAPPSARLCAPPGVLPAKQGSSEHSQADEVDHKSGRTFAFLSSCVRFSSSSRYARRSAARRARCKTSHACTADHKVRTHLRLLRLPLLLARILQSNRLSHACTADHRVPDAPPPSACASPPPHSTSENVLDSLPMLHPFPARGGVPAKQRTTARSHACTADHKV